MNLFLIEKTLCILDSMQTYKKPLCEILTREYIRVYDTAQEYWKGTQCVYDNKVYSIHSFTWGGTCLFLTLSDDYHNCANVVNIRNVKLL